MNLGDDRGIKTPQWLSNMVLRADDLDITSQSSYQNITDQMALSASQDVVDEVIQGLILTPTSLLTCSLSAGAAVSFSGKYVEADTWGFTAGAGDVFSVINPKDQVVGFATADPTNPRIDIIEVRPVETPYNEVSRQFKDPITESITSSLTYTRKEYGVEVQVITGSAAAFPSAPAKTDGWIKLAEVYVSALATTITATDITTWKYAGGWRTETTVTKALDQLEEDITLNMNVSPPLWSYVAAQVPDNLGGHVVTLDLDGTTLSADSYPLPDTWHNGRIYLDGNGGGEISGANSTYSLKCRTDYTCYGVAFSGISLTLNPQSLAYESSFTFQSCTFDFNSFNMTNGLLQAYNGVRSIDFDSNCEFIGSGGFTNNVAVRIEDCSDVKNIPPLNMTVVCDYHVWLVRSVVVDSSNLGGADIADIHPSSSKYVLLDQLTDDNIYVTDMVAKLIATNWSLSTAFTTGMVGMFFENKGDVTLDKFIALGGVATNNFAYSSDGDSWFTVAIPTVNPTGYAYSTEEEIRVVIGGDYIYYSTTNYNAWTAATVSTGGSFTAGCYSPSLNLLVAVGIGASNNVAYSTNGTSWTSVTVASALRDVVWNETIGLFVATSNGGANNIAYSSNGVNWTVTTGTYPSTTIYGLASSDRLGMIIAYGDDIHPIGYTYDGINWNQGSLVTSTDFDGMAYSEELGIFVGGGSGTNQIYYSTDGLTWVSLSPPNAPSITGIAYHKSIRRFGAVSSSTTDGLLLSLRA